MILDKILQLYDTEPDLVKRRQPGKGNPTASAAGGCAAAMQMLRWPTLTSPQPRNVRAAWVFEDGDRIAEDLREKMRRAFPGLSGLEEELFYFRVPIDAATEYRLIEMIVARRLWGTVIRGFLPPRISLGHDGAKDKMRLAPRDARDMNRPQPLGFVVDPGSGALWAPLYVDHVLRHPGLNRLAVVEYKSMSRFAFRKALMGNMGYRERVQLAMIADATGLDTVWFLKCKDTAHLLEMAFVSSPEARHTRMTLLRTNGEQETWWIDRGRATSETTGKTVDEIADDDSWNVGEAWSPYDRSLLDTARARILNVLLYEPPDDPAERLRSWAREYGPSFVCPVCDGTGTQTRRKNGREPLKTPKPCEDCGTTGRMAEATLPWQCSYCATTAACYPMAKLEFAGGRPRYIVRREEVEAAGLTFTPPEDPAAALPIEPTAEAEAVA